MGNVNNMLGMHAKGMSPIIRVYADGGSTVTCDSQSYTLGTSETYHDFDVTIQTYNPLPSTYSGLDCISSSGTQYIDTGYYHTPYTWLDMKFTCLKISDYNTFYGAEPSDNSTGGFCWGWNSGGSLNVDLSSTNTNGVSGTSGIFVLNSTYTFVAGYAGCFINGSYFPIGATGVSTPYSDALFTRHLSSSWTSEIAYVGIYETKIYEGTLNDTSVSKLKRDFIPCKRVSDSVLGMYDLVTGAFFVNGGSGTFTEGNAMEYSRYKEYTVTITTNGSTTTEKVVVDDVGLYQVGTSKTGVAAILRPYRIVGLDRTETSPSFHEFIPGTDGNMTYSTAYLAQQNSSYHQVCGYYTVELLFEDGRVMNIYDYAINYQSTISITLAETWSTSGSGNCTYNCYCCLGSSDDSSFYKTSKTFTVNTTTKQATLYGGEVVKNKFLIYLSSNSKTGTDAIQVYNQLTLSALTVDGTSITKFYVQSYLKE